MMSILCYVTFNDGGSVLAGVFAEWGPMFSPESPALARSAASQWGPRATRPRSAAALSSAVRAHPPHPPNPPPPPSPPLAPQISSSRLNRFFYFISLSSGGATPPPPPHHRHLPSSLWLSHPQARSSAASSAAESGPLRKITHLCS